MTLKNAGRSKRPQDLVVDLSSCATEPIHRPGAIQPHGYLIVISAVELKVSQASENCAALFGRDMEDIIGQPLSSFFKQPTFDTILAYLRLDTSTMLPLPVEIESSNDELIILSCIFRRYKEGYVILELESIIGNAPLGLEAPYSLSSILHHALDRLHQAKTLQESVDIAAFEVKKLTKYDRVMVYRFDADWHGEVIAESKVATLEPLLGLHYPASDIPSQARLLYERNLVRLIVDVDYNSVAVTPTQNQVTSQPLDMSDCVLRSVSPIHVEYLKNMGVQATLTISILLRGKLWGLIACHHYSPLNQPQWVRSACQLFGQNLALKILGIDNGADMEFQLKSRDIIDEIISDARAQSRGLNGGFSRSQNSLITLFECSGAAWILEDEIITCGNAPSNKSIRACLSMLRESQNRFFCTKSSNDLDALDLPPHAVGFLALQIGVIKEEWLILFRPAQPKLVKWAGNPEKAVEMVGEHQRLHPRGSFAVWTEEVKDQAVPWDDRHIEAAEFLQRKFQDLRQECIDVDRRQQKEIEQQRTDFIAAIAHDLKNPVLGTLKVLQLIKDGRMGQNISDLSEVMQQIIDSQETLLSRIKSILLSSEHANGAGILSMEKVDLEAVLLKALNFSKRRAKVDQKFEINIAESAVTLMADEDALCRVFENLIVNAINFSPYNGVIAIDAKSSSSECIVSIKDTGPGIAKENLSQIFQRYWKGDYKKQFAVGNGLGLYICKNILNGHDGNIKCESEPGLGTCFIVSLPIKQTSKT